MGERVPRTRDSRALRGRLRRAVPDEGASKRGDATPEDDLRAAEPDAASGKDANRGVGSRQGGLHVSGLLPADRALALQEARVPVPLAVAQSDEAHPRST